MRSLLVLVLACSFSSASSFAEDSWKGRKVLPKKAIDKIAFVDRYAEGKKAYFPLSAAFPYEVRDDAGGWLRIFDGHREGWAEKADFVLPEDAPAWWNDQLKINPKDTHALTMRGISWDEKGEFDFAIKDYDELIRLKPDDSVAYNNRGSAYSKKKDYDRAIKDYDEAIRFDPKNVRAYNSNAWLLATCPDAKHRDGKKAVELASKAFEQTNTSAALDTLAAAYAESGDFDKAVTAQKKACEDKTLGAEARAKREKRLKLYEQKKPYRDE